MLVHYGLWLGYLSLTFFFGVNMALVPQINSYGVYTLTLPFVTTPKNYRCSSIQLLSALDTNEVDIYNQVYVPKGLDADIYNRDITDNVSIITLVSDTDTITVPSSYIEAIPPELATPYSTHVISLSLGLLPDTVDLTNLVTQVTDLAYSQIGNRPLVATHRIPSKKIISVSESAELEIARALRKQDVVNFYSMMLTLEAENVALRDKVITLETLVINLTPP